MNSFKYRRIPHMPEVFQDLIELSLDLRWSWSQKSDAFWKNFHPEIWEKTKNPFLILQTVSATKLEELAEDPLMRSLARLIIENYHRQMNRQTWFQREHADKDLSVAYFSMEYGLSDSLRIYSGGLGILAGDHLKTCSDLGIPLVGVGLLYQRGYFRQSLDEHGNQVEFYPYNDPGQLPIKSVRDQNGEWLRVAVEFPGRKVYLRTWEARIGQVRLLLLDSNDPLNTPADRSITCELYGGGPETRLQQEMVLGIGGLRMLEALSLKPQVCHLNEGHAAFLVLERAVTCMQEFNLSFAEAITLCRPGNVFTTHTPVDAGFDRFDVHQIERYLQPFTESAKISMEEVLSLGKVNPQDPQEKFNMAFLAVRGSGAVNGVSKLHGQVSKSIFKPLFPGWQTREVPVTYVTNGVHVPSWDSEATHDLWYESCGQEVWLDADLSFAECIRQVPDEKLWTWRNKSRSALVDYARNRVKRQLQETGFLHNKLNTNSNILSPDVLTIGFARRFATYKRSNLLLNDQTRLLKLLNDSNRPIQIVIAGKAHPADQQGKDRIRTWCDFISSTDTHTKVIFLADYDMSMAEQLVQGVDVWLNNPIKPMEASGTSGMKVLVNGGLNFSVPDGWWAEGYGEKVGWNIETASGESNDQEEANIIYSLLENEIIPKFYERDENGIPLEWLEMVRESMVTLTPAFSTIRMLKQYVEDLYLGASATFKARTPEMAREICSWSQEISSSIGKIKIAEIKKITVDKLIEIHVPLTLEGIDVRKLAVQILVPRQGEEHQLLIEMELLGELTWQDNGYEYVAKTSPEAIAKGFYLRLVPRDPQVIAPLETPVCYLSELLN